MNLEIAKKKFMHREICSLCFIASFGMARRHPTFKSGVDREPVKIFLREKLFDLITRYKNGVQPSEHIENIELFQKELKKDYGQQLINGDVGFGRAQKLINLYLKYAWACGFIKKEPPHCPVDSRVIKKLGPKFKDAGMISMERKDYDKIMEAIKEVANANGQSIAEWELLVFNNRRVVG